MRGGEAANSDVVTAYPSAAGRAKAKADLLTDVKEAYENKIMDIYFTEFVMQ